ncbi:tRNA uridine-5-carboxymethylaminomethyl(34) synthesis enzyme MnmG [Acholeplasma granularum]|uniref:tRNA uridine-5-carboxymethylaminomethyl(34) synthesis enzyme MnmG n=1 Tax=Acholeplasma granularum TaxID=264635 RepID=UPI00046EFCD8|nr:tRNA uridine-5-carboxymethylaminomethyl(34) synthesis enzyme MnmG [Acholeplasma granularum]
MIYDGIIVGAGHAGVEAALAMAKMKLNTLLISGDFKKVASLPCNPSIGGPAKGIVVREIDALGGQMAKSADLSQIQMKMLNPSKGPAVRALRAQIDKLKYPKVMLDVLKKQDNLTLLESFVDTLIIEDNKVKGVLLEDGTKIFSKTVIITTGTYLGSQILIGHEKTSSGPNGEKTTRGISNQLKNLGFEMLRLKTGTPPRIAKDSIDYSKTTIQPGDGVLQTFSHDSEITELGHQENSYLIHTSLDTRTIVFDHLDDSAMYGGMVEGVGPRYCPSIEDKFVRFKDKERHQIFIEPESLELNEMYIQGLSTSMPRHVQEQMVKSLPGMENARIIRYAYAIEYDAINPRQLYQSLETKVIENLFCAGQINGTSGYEEAAGQGLMAGINAGLKIQGKEPLILKRDEAYIGVLIDDLITKGTSEPYRLLTSRAEHRLLLRNDNADIRLRDYGYNVGLVSDEAYNRFLSKKEALSHLIDLANTTQINPTEENLLYLKSIGSAPIYEGVFVSKLLERPELGIETLKHFLPTTYDISVYEQLEIHIKYRGYIEKAKREADKLLRYEDRHIPKDINYNQIHNISSEAKEKLSKIKPETLGQATRILGVGPTDVSVLLVYLETQHA